MQTYLDSISMAEEGGKNMEKFLTNENCSNSKNERK